MKTDSLINLNNISSIIAGFTVSAYTVGFIKFISLYYFIGCLWVIDFHSAQDLLLKGSFPTILMLASGLLSTRFSKDPAEAIQRSHTIFSLAGVTLLIILTAIGKLLEGTKVNGFFGNFLNYYMFFFIGPVFMALLKKVQGKASHLSVLQFSIGIPLLLAMTFYFSADADSKTILSGDRGETYLRKKDNKETYILVSSVNGKYLVTTCGGKEFLIIEPDPDWSAFQANETMCLNTKL